MDKVESYLLLLLYALVLGGCESRTEVVVYTAHDRNLSEPVLDAFEKRSGIVVRAVYDTEANKTTGLVNRLLAEKARPQADVFWNNEVGRTLQLKNAGILAAYHSPESASRAQVYRDPAGYWNGFAARARVIIVNTGKVSAEGEPDSLSDFYDPRWQGQVAVADPHFGTTGTHFTALFNRWGEVDFRAWLAKLRENGVAILPGNAQVRDKVASGEYAFGLTDTDDVNGALLDGKPVKMVIPDQGPEGLGVFVIPNTVALINGAPHENNGKRLIDYLLSAEVEDMLAKGRGAQIPLRPDVAGPAVISEVAKLKIMGADYGQIGDRFESMLEVFRSEWPRY